MRRLGWALLLALGVAGCADDRPIAESAPADTCQGEPVVDPALLAFLSKAKSLHHQADLAVDGDEHEQAIAILDRLGEGPIPGDASPPPEAREVLADTLARTAELRSRLGRFDAAEDDVAQGLELARERTLFRGRLMEVRGVVEQRQHDSLLEAGDDRAAEAAKERAIEAFEKAVAIQDEVIERALEGEDGPRDGGQGRGR